LQGLRMIAQTARHGETDETGKTSETGETGTAHQTY
jgi:hypothetical protein